MPAEFSVKTRQNVVPFRVTPAEAKRLVRESKDAGSQWFSTWARWALMQAVGAKSLPELDIPEYAQDIVLKVCLADDEIKKLDRSVARLKLTRSEFARRACFAAL